MKRLLVVLCSLALLLASSVSLAAPKKRGKTDQDEGEKTHIVAPGQTLAKIAKRYRVTVEALREANDLPAGRLKPGTKLVIPSDDAPAEKPKGKSKGKAGQGDEDRDSESDDDKADKKKGKRKADKKKDKEEEEDEDAIKPGHVRLVHGDQSWEGRAVEGKAGAKVTPAATKAFTRMLAPASGEGHSIDKRLISLVVAVSDHFGGKPIEIVSGFRPATSKQHPSKHNTGSAIDFRVRGVRNEELRDFVRTFKKVGVGYYPNSSFVHLDVRPTSTYWVDHSGPGETPQYHKEGPNKEASDEDKKSDKKDDKKDGKKPRKRTDA